MALMVVANRYARALAEVVAPTGNYGELLRELEDFAASTSASAELREVFETPAIPLPDKTKVLEAILKRLGASAVTTNFLRVLLAHYRMGLLSQVVQAFRKIANTRQGIVEVKVFSAAALAPPELEALRARFAELTRRQVQLEFELDPSLLGGALAQIDSTIYDGSVRGQLERIRQQLLAR